jgi:Rps23 Pro-64 3,4-dihydroxylase Tpa1-like proline 4-hydroxylase
MNSFWMLNKYSRKKVRMKYGR